MSRVNSKMGKSVRRKLSKERSEYRATLSPSDQLNRLDSRLGKGMGALKERFRLHEMLHPHQTTDNVPANKPKRKVKKAETES